MNLWTKEIIAENLRDLPAGVREVRSRTAAAVISPCRRAAAEAVWRRCASATGLRCAWNGMWPMDFTPGMGQSRAFWS